MYVKTLTLKGFKSFASATTLRLEPGVTCVVGPNGAGKSNVVDALAWVMGEQGAKSLRGGKMEDVIFAGTTGRAPLGRAEVTMTIDNTDGALPIDYTEVTLRRTLFRNGGSEYAINGTSCRLLDIQELLSDSGIGREMHVVVGQGQLDAVLRATPEERRGFIEEAAGVLKHRKRKERALRKLEAMEVNLTRVCDLTSEIRRQLGPLGRQAEAARRAAVIQADARDARCRLLADDWVQATAVLEREVADETALYDRRAVVEEEVSAAQARIADLEGVAARAVTVLAAQQDRWVTLRSLRDRLESTRSLAVERIRLLNDDDVAEHTSERDPEELRARAEQARREEADLLADVSAAQVAVAESVSARGAAESAAAAENARIARITRAAADRREGLAKLAGDVGAHRSRVEAAEAEIGRLTAAAAASRARAAASEQEFAALEASVAVAEEGEEGLDADYERAAAAHQAHCAEVDEWVERERVAERLRAAAAARLEALQLTLRRKDGADRLLGPDAPDGIRGSLADVIDVEPGYDVAIAAALDWAADAVTSDGPAAAAAAVAGLREGGHGRAAVVVGGTSGPSGDGPLPPLPPTARWAHSVVTAAPDFAGAVAHRLHNLVVVETFPDAREVVTSLPMITAVTAQGDLVGPGFVRGGSAGAPSLLELHAAVAETQAALSEQIAAAHEARFRLVAAREALRASGDEVDGHLERLHESDATMASVAERLGALGAEIRSANAEVERLHLAIASAQRGLDGGRAQLAELSDRLAAAEGEPEEDAAGWADARGDLEAAARAARAAETDARLQLRTKEERARGLRERAASLETAARDELASRARLQARRERRRREADVAESVRVAADFAVARLTRVSENAREEVSAREGERSAREAELASRRGALTAAQETLARLTAHLHRDELVRAAQVAQVEHLRIKAVEELGVDPDALVEEFGPHVPVPTARPLDEGEAATAQPYIRNEQERRLRRAERGLRDLGRVNPLALEEYAALEERQAFLTRQIEDLRSSKRDLLDIVREVDRRVEDVFSAAYADTAAQFERVFARLFPGGEGRLSLTDPGNMLATGIEVEARPPGKKIKRLSLLSGGERSLVAVALLVAIFKARPSPFYVLDEVEAALDDTNLGRLLTLFEELRDSSQLIVITHQKRTMEIADALYGVSMRGDGVTTLVSQRLRTLAAETVAG